MKSKAVFFFRGSHGANIVFEQPNFHQSSLRPTSTGADSSCAKSQERLAPQVDPAEGLGDECDLHFSGSFLRWLEMWREWSSAKLCVFEILCVYIIYK